MALHIVQSQLFVLKERGKKLENLLVELVDVVDHEGTQEFGVNQLSTVRSNSQVLPTIMVCVNWVFFAEDDILNSDSELSILVEAWLV